MTERFALHPDEVHRRRGQIYVGLAAAAWSTAGVLQRDVGVDLMTQVSGRAFFAMIALLAYVTAVERGETMRAFRGMGYAGLGFAVCLAVASSSFIAALNYTTVANVLFLQATAPIVAAALAWIFLAEGVSRSTCAAMALALAGVALMIGGPEAGSAAGIAFSLLMTVAFSVAIVLTRHRRDISMAPGTCVAQLMVLTVAAPFADPRQVDGHALAILFLLGAFQIGLGLALLTVGARFIPATEVALITLLEVVLGPLWVWAIYAETPAATTLLGGTVIIIAVALQAGAPRVRAMSRRARTGA